ncbi:hypothetical protein, unknown function [Leishmania tarentolae]|uniref:ELMO domain-containing protein n=1 Tax=Leishmania tarentolae TaxID=5689 RepID=A0A640KKT8_LEITA|nr:hypothetical protein, unknown function [Leishmania tarentolae]
MCAHASLPRYTGGGASRLSLASCASALFSCTQLTQWTWPLFLEESGARATYVPIEGLCVFLSTSDARRCQERSLHISTSPLLSFWIHLFHEPPFTTCLRTSFRRRIVSRAIHRACTLRSVHEHNHHLWIEAEKTLRKHPARGPQPEEQNQRSTTHTHLRSGLRTHLSSCAFFCSCYSSSKMRQRKGAPPSVVPSTAEKYVAYPGSSDSSNPAHQAGSTNTLDLRHRATTTASTTTDAGSFQWRANRLEEMERSLYYTPKFLWLQVMDRMPYEVAHCLVSPLPPQHEAMLGQIREQYGRPYSSAKTFDVELLGRLWNGHSRVVFATDDLVFSAAAHSVSDRWKEMGFQGPDPSTDFRGAGIFGLAQLVYLVEHHPEQWSAILTPDFMVAAAGLNVTMRLATLLGINSSLNQFSTSILSTYSAREARLRLCRLIFDPSADVVIQRLGEVYCFAMRLLHYRWMHSTRNIMELNEKLTKMYTELDRLLFLCNTLEELCSLL